MNKKGFTLIELLAVILILGIIALIAVPTVSKVLDDSKQGTFKSTVNNLTKKIEETCSMEILKDKSITNSYTIIDGKLSTPLNIKGDLPDGEISVDSDCNVTYELTNNSYKAVKKNYNEEVELENCKENCSSYSEDLLNGAKPSLDYNMIPIILENNGTVKKADIYSKWYSYENQEWANAILVTDDTLKSYQNANTGTIINQEDIIGYFVWIPRYKYRISTGGTETPSSIDIIFENKMVEKSLGNATTEYHTHPGFTFGEQELNGIWFGKFETTGTGDNPTILPNITSLRMQDTKTQFETAKRFNDYNNTIDIHMMKSTEWATALYLSHSKYGINKEIRLNNNNLFLTGCGAGTITEGSIVECKNSYASDIEDYPQSTTKNITGIFDMSGGTTERVMGNFEHKLSLSNFTNLPESKYYDFYTSTDYTTRCGGTNCPGHIIYETQRWYGNINYNTTEGSPFVTVGGHHDLSYGDFGAFAISQSTGQAFRSDTFRVALVK